ncbi:hypothetical protein ACFU90_28495 [Streptomyces noursei]|uniref:Chaplin domain-containing protein n=2 Tax=Streptomyces noursei TaxID=1971 RepID=A0A401QWQ7_STRNR|nr:hypothetical protein [Streptomyces noursei]UWS70981.1 hypothetical protein N1H47_06835 [Streptomyces noursei]GCB89748.1 hypothetical protein SALB_02437 [Streptomyces noursei]
MTKPRTVLTAVALAVSATAFIAPAATAATAAKTGVADNADPQLCPPAAAAGCAVVGTFGKALHAVGDLYSGSTFSDADN